MKPVFEFCCLRRVSGLFEAISPAGPHKRAVKKIREIKERKTLFMESGLDNTNVRIS
jgi:hypothetical protein